MFFDCAALIIGLAASYAATWHQDAKFPFGYGRFQQLAGFVNGIFLLFVALAVSVESIDRLREPPEIHSPHLVATSVAGLLINCVGVLFFHDFSHGHGHSHGGSECSHHGADQNIRGVFLHILADTLGSVGVVVSALVMRHSNFYIIDPICSLMISGLILASTVPLLQDTASALLLHTPQSATPALLGVVSRVSRLPNVVATAETHFWSMGRLGTAGSIVVYAQPACSSSERQQILLSIRKLLTGAGIARAAVEVRQSSSGKAFSSGDTALYPHHAVQHV